MDEASRESFLERLLRPRQERLGPFNFQLGGFPDYWKLDVHYIGLHGHGDEDDEGDLPVEEKGGVHQNEQHQHRPHADQRGFDGTVEVCA